MRIKEHIRISAWQLYYKCRLRGYNNIPSFRIMSYLLPKQNTSSPAKCMSSVLPPPSLTSPVTWMRILLPDDVNKCRSGLEHMTSRTCVRRLATKSSTMTSMVEALVDEQGDLSLLRIPTSLKTERKLFMISGTI